MTKKYLVLLIILGSMMGLLTLSPQGHPVHGQDSITIRFAHTFSDFNDVRLKALNEMTERFMQDNPHITVVLESEVNYDAVFERVQLDAMQGEPAHIVHLDETAPRHAVDLGIFVRLSDPEVTSPEQLAELDDLISPALGYYEVDGMLWGIPWDVQNPVLIYNKNLFTAAGLDANTPPTTFDEIVAMCDVIMQSDIESELDGCINWPLTTWFTESWLAMQGALLVDENNGHDGYASTAFFTDDAMLNIVNWWQMMADLGYYNYTGVQADYVGEGIAFITQRYAMHLSSSAGISNFEIWGKSLGYEIGVTPLPRPDANADQGVPTSGGSLWITQGHSQAEQDAARDFVFYLIEAENIALFHQKTGSIPNRYSALEILETTGFWEENPLYYVGIEQMLNTTPSPSTAGAIIGPSDAVRTVFANTIRAIIDSGVAPEDALSNAKDQIELILYDYNRVYAN